MLETLRTGTILPSPRSSATRNSLHESANHVPEVPVLGVASPARLPAFGVLSWPAVLSVAEDYLEYCESQPITLFHRGDFLTSLEKRDPEIVYSILALAMRFSRDPTVRRTAVRDSATYIQTAHRLAMDHITEGCVELSTIQTFCLLSLVEFYGTSLKISARSHLS